MKAALRIFSAVSAVSVVWLAAGHGAADGASRSTRHRVAAGTVSRVIYRSSGGEFALFSQPSQDALALGRLDARARRVGATTSAQPEPAPADPTIDASAAAYDPRDDRYMIVAEYERGELRAQALSGSGTRLGQAFEVAPQAVLVGVLYDQRRDSYLVLWVHAQATPTAGEPSCIIEAQELAPSGEAQHPPTKVSVRPSCANEFGVGAFYDSRAGGYLVTWPGRRGTVGRELTAAGAPRGSPRRVGEGQLQTLTFNSRLGRYVGVFFRHDASGAGKLQVEQLRPDGTFCAHGETLRPPRNAAIGATDIASAPNADETLLDWTLQYGGYSENSPEVDHLYADLLSGDGRHRLRRLKLDTVGTASGSIAAYDPRHQRFLVLWPTRRHGSTVTYGELISGAS